MTRPPVLHRIKAGVRVLYQFHGPWFPFVLVQRTFLYAKRKFWDAQTFEFAGKTYRYHIHPYSLKNERAVEVSLALDFLREHPGEILEIGNVLSNYASIPHEVVDKYEKAPGVINEDVVTFAPGKKYDSIVTVSTLEHVGWDETPREPEKIIRAINHLKELLKDHGELFVTMPMDSNDLVDKMVREQKTGFTEVRYLSRFSASNQWRESTREEAVTAKYGSPFPCANAIVIGRFRKNAG